MNNPDLREDGRSSSVTTYDVFLSYSSPDRAPVEAVARALKVRGLRVFLDQYVEPGKQWLKALEESLTSCRAAAVFVRQREIRPWQMQEISFALNRHAKDSAFPIVPVVLPGADLDQPSGFLALFQWIDLRGGIDDKVQLDALAAALCPGIAQPPPPVAVCPYRGLRRFHELDAPFFFGRETFTKQLTQAVEHQRLVAVVGSSGSGKSSVVRAGLFPRLREAHAERVWNVVAMYPGDQPLRALAGALLPLLEPELSEVDRLAEIQKLASLFYSGGVTLRDVVIRVLEKQSGTNQLLVLVDQWEELYTLCHDELVRRRFIDGLLEVTERGALSIVMTLRGDFYGHLVGYRRLADRVQEGVLNLGPMTRNELKQAITEPARQVGLSFEPGLVDRILDDVEREPGNLPLLEFVLTELWASRSDGQLMHAAYATMGEAQGAIAQRAEAEFGKLQEGDQDRLRRILMQLVRPGEAAPDTRRRATFTELGEVARPIVQQLAAARLLVTAHDDATGLDTVEVAHEALIGNWQRLRDWVTQDRDFLLWRQRISAALNLWKQAERGEDLLRGTRLTEAIRWLEERPDDLNDDERVFVAKSARVARMLRWRRRTGRGAVAAALISLAWFGVSEVHSIRRENEMRARAILNEAEDAQDPLIAALLVGELAGEREPEGGATRARRVVDAIVPIALFRGHSESVSRAVFSSDGSHVVTTSLDSTARLWRTDGMGDPIVLGGHQGAVYAAAFSADGSQVVTSSEDGTARVWRTDGGGNVVVLHGHTGTVWGAEFSPDGTHVVTASDDGTARVWRADGGGNPLILKGHQAGVLTARFNWDGSRVVTASEDGTARVWRTDRPAVPVLLSGHQGKVYSAGFSQDGSRVVTASSDGTARIWRADGTGSPVVLRGHKGTVWAAAFSPDRTHVVTASEDGTARVWRTDGAGAFVELRGHTGTVWGAEFSPDGTHVVTASNDSTARVWRADGKDDPLILRGHEGAVFAAAFSPDGSHLVTTSSDASARLWQVSGIGEPVVLVHHAGLLGVAVSPDGSRVATASIDGTAWVWRADGTGKPVILQGHGGPVSSVAFSPDGSRLVTASQDSIVRVWAADGSNAPIILTGHEGAVSMAEFSPDGSRIVTASDDKMARLWQADGTGDALVLRGHTSWVRSARFSPNGKSVVTASGDGTARIWSADGKGDPVVLRHDGAVFSAEFSPNGARVVTASEDSTVRIWRTDGTETVILRGHKGWVRQAEFSPDGSLVVTAAVDGTARIWSADGSGAPLVLRGHQKAVRSANFSHDGSRVITGSLDPTVRVWRTDGKGAAVVLRGHQREVTSAVFTPDGSRVVTASEDSTARVWRVSWASLVVYLQRSTTACLTGDQRVQLLKEQSATAQEHYEKCERHFHRSPVASTPR